MPSEHDKHALAAGVATTAVLAMTNSATSSSALKLGLAVGLATDIYMRRYGHTLFGDPHEHEKHTHLSFHEHALPHQLPMPAYRGKRTDPKNRALLSPNN